MSYRVTLLPLLLLCFVATAAFGASESSPAFVRVVVSPPPEGNAPLTLLFDSDEALCKKAYGEEWGGPLLRRSRQRGRKSARRASFARCSRRMALGRRPHAFLPTEKAVACGAEL